MEEVRRAARRVRAVFAPLPEAQEAGAGSDELAARRLVRRMAPGGRAWKEHRREAILEKPGSPFLQSPRPPPSI